MIASVGFSLEDAAGDTALRTLSQTVREFLSTQQLNGATFARVGGEEFIFLLPDMESDAVIALNRPAEWEVHIQGGLNNGLTKAEIREAIIHAAVYCGFPAALDATKIARKVLA